MSHSVHTIILAGGKGTRLHPYTTVFPKPLMPIDGVPILEIILRQLKVAGFQNVTLCVGYLSNLIEAYFAKGEKWNMAINYSVENTPLGTAGPLGLIKSPPGPFIVMNGDVLTSMDYQSLLDFHASQNALVTIAVCKKEVPIDLGVVEYSQNLSLSQYIEKPTLNYHVSMGIYVMNPEILKLIPSGVKYDLPDLIRNLIQKNIRVACYEFDGYWLDIGRMEDYASAASLFEKNRSLFLPHDIS